MHRHIFLLFVVYGLFAVGICQPPSNMTGPGPQIQPSPPPGARPSFPPPFSYPPYASAPPPGEFPSPPPIGSGVSPG
uniref:Vegetative cell wall protein gp1-like n=1 Tax=Panagrellus redivivus TaxID=6233 RepID=A0A7E4VQV3_PANRE